jgi:prepilin-type N-terminal cleavage/methylation domain-containing protein
MSKMKAMKYRREHGFTLIEVLAVVALVGVIFLVIHQFLSPILTFFQGNQSRQVAALEARVCLTTIERLMANGKASTLTISTPATTPVVQSSQAQFLSVDGSTYTITWSMTPANSIHVLQTMAPGTTVNDTVLTTHATQLTFSWSDPRDPSTIDITLQITVPLDASHVSTILLPNQRVQMIAF